MVKYTYNAWGVHTFEGNETLANINPYRYRGYYYDTETGLYFLKTRYYDPVVGRFISMDDVAYIDPETIGGLNLFAYCNNNPVMHVDPNGRFAIAAVVAIAIAAAATINDIYQIANGSLNVSVSSETVKIENSYKILTPWMRWGYSFYLNHFNDETKDIIGGSTSGIQFEWMLHNYAYWLGFGGESAKHLDVGNTIFNDMDSHPMYDKDGNLSLTGVMSSAMTALYFMFSNPINWISDLYVNGGI